MLSYGRFLEMTAFDILRNPKPKPKALDSMDLKQNEKGALDSWGRTWV